MLAVKKDEEEKELLWPVIGNLFIFFPWDLRGTGSVISPVKNMRKKNLFVFIIIIIIVIIVVTSPTISFSASLTIPPFYY